MTLATTGNYSLSGVNSIGYAGEWPSDQAGILDINATGLMEAAGESGNALTLAAYWVWLWGSIVMSFPPARANSDAGGSR